MNILLTNDDGIYAPGLWALYEQFAKNHRITVIAPDRERSAVSHSISVHDPLRTDLISVNGWKGYAVNGTPADCIKVGFLEILKANPDMVISGINPGANVGVNINYSGTVAAAREAVMYGVPAIAVSAKYESKISNKDIADFTESLALKVIENGLPFGTLLNLNFPDVSKDQIAGVRIIRQGISLMAEYFEKRTDPRNRPYLWLGGEIQTYDGDPDIDVAALEKNFITITPIKCDCTDYSFLNELRNWHISSLT